MNRSLLLAKIKILFDLRIIANWLFGDSVDDELIVSFFGCELYCALFLRH
jgi:hypothetical protein